MYDVSNKLLSSEPRFKNSFFFYSLCPVLLSMPYFSIKVKLLAIFSEIVSIMLF